MGEENVRKIKKSKEDGNLFVHQYLIKQSASPARLLPYFIRKESANI